MTGSWNVAVGYYSLSAMRAGSYNAAVGTGAIGGAASTGSGNTAVGNYEMYATATYIAGIAGATTSLSPASA